MTRKSFRIQRSGIAFGLLVSAAAFGQAPQPLMSAKDVNELCLRSTQLMEAGGVDILKRADGCYVLEANFPCFFALAQIRVGIDVAGPMLDYLVRKAGHLAGMV